jgi:hypothetical protein
MGASARPTDPDTSHAAAASLDPEHIRKSQAAVLRVLGAIGAASDHGLVETYALMAGVELVHPQSPSGIRTRRKELTRLGRVLDTGHRERTSSGRHAIVWAVAAR